MHFFGQASQGVSSSLPERANKIFRLVVVSFTIKILDGHVTRRHDFRNEVRLF
jgi:hypothetical protein